MSPDALKNSICPDCYHCEYERKQMGAGSFVDCQCAYPQHRHQFGHVKARTDCQGFFRHAVLMETSDGHACLLPIGARPCKAIEPTCPS